MHLGHIGGSVIAVGGIGLVIKVLFFKHGVAKAAVKVSKSALKNQIKDAVSDSMKLKREKKSAEKTQKSEA